MGVENDHTILGERYQSERPKDETQNAVNLVHFDRVHGQDFAEGGVEDVERGDAEVAVHHSTALVCKCQKRCKGRRLRQLQIQITVSNQTPAITN